MDGSNILFQGFCNYPCQLVVQAITTHHFLKRLVVSIRRQEQPEHLCGTFSALPYTSLPVGDFSQSLFTTVNWKHACWYFQLLLDFLINIKHEVTLGTPNFPAFFQSQNSLENSFKLPESMRAMSSLCEHHYVSQITLCSKSNFH